jgi:ferric-dicitrate binding protein FerR (iron transport regulator)
VTGDELRQRFETLETEVLSLADAPAADAIRRRGRRRQRTVRAAGLLAVALLAAATAGGIDRWSPRSDQHGTGAEHHPSSHRRRGGPDRGAPG